MPIRLRVRHLRTELGLTQAELAARAGVRRATISHLESDGVVGIEFDVIVRVGRALRLANPIQVLEYVPCPQCTAKEGE